MEIPIDKVICPSKHPLDSFPALEVDCVVWGAVTTFGCAMYGSWDSIIHHLSRPVQGVSTYICSL